MFRLALPLLLTVLILGCSGDGDETDAEAPSDASPAATQFPGSRPPPGATPSSPSAGLVDARLELSGVFLEPRFPEPDGENGNGEEENGENGDEAPEPAGLIELPPRPESPFRAWDGASVVLYDTETGEQHDFGPGRIWSPPFGGGHFAYTSDNEVWLVDLETMEGESIGQGIGAYFMGDGHVVINPGDNMFYALRLDTRGRTALTDLTSPLLRSMVEQRWGGQFLGSWLDGRYAIYNPVKGAEVCDEEAKDYRICLAEHAEVWVVEDLNTGEVLLSFRADKALPAGREEIVIATTPQCDDAGRLVSCYRVLERLEVQNPGTSTQATVEGTSNIFLVDVRTGEAEFVATVPYNAGVGAWPVQWPLTADADHVIWTDSYCGNPRGRTSMLDRETGQLAVLDLSAWVTLRNGRLGLGESGAKALLDPATLEYTAVLPALSDVTWSPDYRYAAVGQSFTHPGVCE